MLDFENNETYAARLNDTPRFARIVSEIRQRRRSELVQRYQDSNFGAKGQDGAVLILW